jgi:hypothetical protein
MSHSPAPVSPKEQHPRLPIGQDETPRHKPPSHRSHMTIRLVPAGRLFSGLVAEKQDMCNTFLGPTRVTQADSRILMLSRQGGGRNRVLITLSALPHDSSDHTNRPPIRKFPNRQGRHSASQASSSAWKASGSEIWGAWPSEENCTSVQLGISLHLRGPSTLK